MDRLTTDELFDALRREDRKVLAGVYKLYFPSVRNYILLNSGNDFDAQDIFQDALVIIYIKIRVSAPSLSCTFSTYLFSICKYLWYKEIRRKNRSADSTLEIDELIDFETNFLKDYIRMEKRKLVMDHFNEMGEECKRLLRLIIDDTPIRRITMIMGFSSDQYTRNRRVSCKDSLVRRIWNSPRYKELRNEAHRENSQVPRW
jgi:RNA polymerase sigma factor (sigma-70 family)